MKKISIIIAILLLAGFVYSKNVPKMGYKIVNKIHLEGDEKWDYLYSDDATGLLYVSHGNIVQVVDEAKGIVIGKISGLNSVHGIAIDKELNKGFITGGKDSSVTVFDIKSLKIITKIKVTGKGPDGILFDQFSKNVFAFNGKSNNATVINALTNAIVATIPFAGNPEFSQTDCKGKIYVNLEDISSIAVINTATNKVESVWSIAPGEEPTGLALDNENHRLFSVCKNKLMIIIDAENGKVITTLPVGAKADGAAFDPALKCAYSSNGEGTVTVAKEANKDLYSVLETIETQKGAKTITINRKTHHLYLPTAEFETVSGAEKSKLVPGTFIVLDIVPQ